MRSELAGEEVSHWRERVFSFPAAMIAVVVAIVLVLCRPAIGDPDLWWHLRNGEYIASTGHLPRVDLLSFTTYGKPWFDHSWLSELIYFESYRVGGLEGVYVVFACAAALLAVGVFLLARAETDDALSAGVLTCLGVLLADVGFTPRAQHFGWLCFLAIFAILLRYRRERQAPLWLIPLLFLLWINLHGGWPFGFVIWLIIGAAGLLTQDVGPFRAQPWTARERRALLATAAISVAALFVNPYGYRLVLYPFDLAFHQKVNVGNIKEWTSVDFNTPLGMYVLALLFLLLVVLWTSERRWKIADALLLVCMIFFALKHVRFLLLAGLVLPPTLAPYVALGGARVGRRWTMNAAVLAMAVVLGAVAIPSPGYLQAQTDLAFPAKAVGYLREHPVEGHLYNYYDWGGYLDWHLRGDRVFVDPRADVFEWNGVLQDYFAILRSQGSLALLDRYKITHVLIKKGIPLDYLLEKSGQWRAAYGDDQAVVYVRANP